MKLDIKKPKQTKKQAIVYPLFVLLKLTQTPATAEEMTMILWSLCKTESTLLATRVTQGHISVELCVPVTISLAEVLLIMSVKNAKTQSKYLTGTLLGVSMRGS